REHQVLRQPLRLLRLDAGIEVHGVEPGVVRQGDVERTDVPLGREDEEKAPGWQRIPLPAAGAGGPGRPALAGVLPAAPPQAAESGGRRAQANGCFALSLRSVTVATLGSLRMARAIDSFV